MGHKTISCALEGEGQYAGNGYFFHNAQYSKYNWKKDQAVDGYPLPLALWNLPAQFASDIDGAVNGQAKFKGKAYFFKDGLYTRYDWKNNKTDSGYPASLSAWKLPAKFNNGIDGVVNGEARFKDKAYFFKKDEYVRYDWKNDAVDQGYPKKLSLWGLPARFLTGIDAVINGEGKFKGKAYFFKGDEYARFDWASDKLESVGKVDKWPLLFELICAGSGKSKTFDWIWIAMPKLKAYINTLQTGAAYIYNQALIEQALNTHFKIPTTMAKADKIKNLQLIYNNYSKVEKALHNNNESFRGRNLVEATRDKAVNSAGVPYPAYTWFNSSINFTPTFLNFGPLCQAAMVLHETVHYVDGVATAANDIYEHSPAYNTMTLAQALHNPSSYVCFAEHLYYLKDERYGAGRPNL